MVNLHIRIQLIWFSAFLGSRAGKKRFSYSKRVNSLISLEGSDWLGSWMVNRLNFEWPNPIYW